MKMNPSIRVFGDIKKRGRCPSEALEQVTFFARLRRDYPDLGKIAIHPRNEGKRHFAQTQTQKAEGMVKGSSDIIIPCCPPFICELKRQNHTQSTWQDGQQEYLLQCQKMGAFVCVALGADAAIEALKLFLKKFS